MRLRLFGIVAGLAMSAVGVVYAQVTQVVGYNGTNPENFATTTVSSSISVTRTLTLSPSSPGSARVGYAVSGADFAATGGTCTPTTILDSVTPSCTLTLTFAPTTAGSKSGNLGFNCQFVALVGGITLTCTDAAAQAPGVTNIALNGTALGSAAVAAPMLGRAALTLLACVILGFALFSMRRRAQD